MKVIKRYLLRYLKRYPSIIMRRKLKEKSIRKVYRKAGSYGVTIPMEIIKALKIKEGQKVVITRKGQKIMIEDWK